MFLTVNLWTYNKWISSSLMVSDNFLHLSLVNFFLKPIFCSSFFLPIICGEKEEEKSHKNSRFLCLLSFSPLFVCMLNFSYPIEACKQGHWSTYHHNPWEKKGTRKNNKNFLNVQKYFHSIREREREKKS